MRLIDADELINQGYEIAGEIMCNYASITDELRNCSSDHCLRYEPKGV